MKTLGRVLLDIDKIDVGQHKQTLMKSHVRKLNSLGLDLDIDLVALSKNSISELRTLRTNLIAN